MCNSFIVSLSTHNALILASGKTVRKPCHIIISGQICLSINGWALAQGREDIHELLLLGSITCRDLSDPPRRVVGARRVARTSANPAGHQSLAIGTLYGTSRAAKCRAGRSLVALQYSPN